MSLTWKDTYKVGQLDIDEQHQHFFELTPALVETDDLPTLRGLINQN
jgi:hemerythrin